jgi:hypothetical protein
MQSKADRVLCCSSTDGNVSNEAFWQCRSYDKLLPMLHLRTVSPATLVCSGLRVCESWSSAVGVVVVAVAAKTRDARDGGDNKNSRHAMRGKISTLPSAAVDNVNATVSQSPVQLMKVALSRSQRMAIGSRTHTWPRVTRPPAHESCAKSDGASCAYTQDSRIQRIDDLPTSLSG